MKKEEKYPRHFQEFLTHTKPPSKYLKYFFISKTYIIFAAKFKIYADIKNTAIFDR